MLNKNINLSSLAFTLCFGVIIAFLSVVVIIPFILSDGFLPSYIYEGEDNLPTDIALSLENEIDGFDIISISEETAYVEYKFGSKSLDLHNTYGLKYTDVSTKAAITKVVIGVFICTVGFHFFITLCNKFVTNKKDENGALD